MARDTSPILKRCRALGIEPQVLGINKTSNRRPQRRRRRDSEYGLQLREKQKLKFIYGVLEKPFRNYFEQAVRMPGNTGENMLQLLECRLDNVVFRAGFASTRQQARQLITHNHFTINGKRASIPSIQVNVGDVIEVKDASRGKEYFKNLDIDVITPAWMDMDEEALKCRIIQEPKREDLDFEVEERLVVELYSR